MGLLTRRSSSPVDSPLIPIHLLIEQDLSHMLKRFGLKKVVRAVPNASFGGCLAEGF